MLRGVWGLVSGSLYLGVHGVVIRTSVLRCARGLVSGHLCLGVHGAWYQDLCA